jgi:hypothetical protein
MYEPGHGPVVVRLRARLRSIPGPAGHSRGMNYTQTGQRMRLFA